MDVNRLSEAVGWNPIKTARAATLSLILVSQTATAISQDQARATLAAGPYQRVSVASDGTQADGPSDHAALSANGRCVVFESRATNLVPGDTNGVFDIFVFELESRTTTRVSVAGGGAQANGPSSAPAISDDCRFVVFESDATNLVAGTMSGTQVYLRDRISGSTSLASVSTAGVAANAPALRPVISGDGRYVAFVSVASNLVAGDTNGCADVFTHDAVAGVTSRNNVSSTGEQMRCTQPGYPILTLSISRDGRYVAFDSDGRNLVPGLSEGDNPWVFLRDRLAGVTTIESTKHATSTSMSADGRYMAFTTRDVFFSILIRDRLTGEIRAPVLFAGGTSGPFGAPQLSEDGRYLSYWHHQTQPPSGDQVVVFDSQSRVWNATVCCDDRVDTRPSAVVANRVAFVSASPSLVDSDTNALADIFIADLTQTAPPGPTRNLTATLVGSTLTLNWLPPADGRPIDSYFLRAGSSSGRIDLANIRIRPPVTSYAAAVGGAGPYFLGVSADNEFGLGLESNEIAVTTDGSALPPSAQSGAPQRLQGSTNGSTVTLRWEAPALGAVSGYQLSVGSFFHTTDLGVVETGNATTSFTATGVPPGSYYVRVRARNGSSLSAESNDVLLLVSSAAPCNGPPGAPGWLRASTSGSTVRLSWSTAGGTPTSYVIEAGSSTSLANLASFDTGGVATTFTASGVAIGTYFVRVRGKNSCGIGPASNEVALAVTANSP